MNEEELLTIDGNWNFDYRYFAGETASRFFREIRENARIMGTRSPSSGMVLVPARAFSDADYEATTDWVETGPGGTLDVFTIVGIQFPDMPPPPFIIGYVTLDGADTAIANHITGIDLSDLDEAARFLMTQPRVKAIFSEKREGRITDFHFELEKGGDH